MRARTAPRRVAGTAIGVLLAVVFSAGPAAAAPPDGQVPADQVAQLADQLARAQAAADSAHAQSALALDEYQVRNERFTAARTAADQATAAAASAEADLQASRADLHDFARRSYMSHSTYAGAAALLTSGSPTEFVDRTVLLNAAGAYGTDAVGRFTAARDSSGQAQAAAQAALADATGLQQAAADALTRAENAERAARQQATDLAAERERLQQEIDAAQAALAATPVAAAPAPAPAPATNMDPVLRTEAGPGSPQAAQDAIEAALTQLGTPYSWGGGGTAGPGPGIDLDTGVVGYDCSALTQYAYGRAGVSVPRTSREQFTNLPKVAKADLQPGDLVFWAHNPADPTTIHHVALYLGGGKVVQAPESGDVVRISDIWWTGYAGAVRPTA
jgi:cell wall-associated NlpC family hydrolase